MLGAHLARPGDVILVNGLLGDHGAAILGARGDMALETAIESDCAALHGLIETLLAAAPGTRAMRDATRGGLATVLNEIAVGLAGRDRDRRGGDADPRGGEGLLRDPRPRSALPRQRRQDRRHRSCGRGRSRACRHARPSARRRRDRIIGRVHQGEAGRVTMRTVFGGRRIVDMLVGEQLPRIC